MITSKGGWQPVRVQITHGKSFMCAEDIRKILSTVLPGRPYDLNIDGLTNWYRCDSTHFFVVDVRSLHLESGDSYIFCCEHDLLAD
jgi:hypothetical protein